MIYTPQNPPHMTELSCDVLIIGSGAGGSMAAEKLTKQGYTVIMVEEGPYVTKEDFTQDEREMVPLMYRKAGALATDDLSVQILQGKVYGGSTTINWMTSLRTPEFVLNEWAEDFGLEHYRYPMMKRHFEEIEKRLSIHNVPDDQHNPQNRIILEGGEALGLDVGSLPNNSEGCIGCGYCGLGCKYDAKQDMRLTYLKDAQNSGLIVYTSTRADKIQYHGNDRQITKAIMSEGEPDQLTLRIESRRTVVSGGAVYSPLLLQTSGLAKSKFVGRFFKTHPVGAVFASYDRDIFPTYGIAQSAYSKNLNADGNGYGWWLEAPDLEPFLAGIHYPAIGIDRYEGMKQLQQSAVSLVLVRDGANKRSNGSVRWMRGYNSQNGSFSFKKRPSIRYRVSREDMHHILSGIKQATEIHFAAGAEKVLPVHADDITLTSAEQSKKILDLPSGPNQLAIFSAHPMGTVQMGKEPTFGAIDEYMEMHDYPGIYVMDGSTLPTALGVNPMLTILASVSRAIELGNLNL